MEETERLITVDMENQLLFRFVKSPFDKTLWLLGSVFRSAASCNQCWGAGAGEFLTFPVTS